MKTIVKGRIEKLVRAVGLAVLGLLVLVVGGSTAAVANTGGGLGGGSSGGSLTGPIHWKSIAYEKPGVAYDKFIQLSGWSKENAENQIHNRVGDIQVCKESKVIWYVNHNAQQKWVFNYSYTATHGNSWNNHHNASGTIEDPHAKVGERAPYAAEVAAFKKWDREINGSRINGKPGYTIICSGSFSPPADLVEKWNEVDPKKKVVTYAHNQPHSYRTSIEPQLNEYNDKGKLVDPIGLNNLEVQPAKTSRTNYGVLLDDISTGKLNADINKTNEKIKQAIAKDKARDHTDVRDLSDNNKAGMAEGGVLNITGFERNATITLTQKNTTINTRDCKRTTSWNTDKNRWNKPVQSCTAWKGSVTKGEPVVGKDYSTMKNTGFWQMLSVHCNPLEFAALKKSGNNIQVIKDGNPQEHIGAAAYTKHYNTRPAVLDFGDAKNKNKARAATASIGFYDKECAYDCRPLGEVSAGKTVKGGKKGAYSNDTNNNAFTFFRDNENKSVTVDVWEPSVGGAVKSAGKPLTTTVTRWSEGTPSTTGNDGGQFSMSTADGKKLFVGDKKPTMQKNWETSTFSNSTSTSLEGLHNKFNVRSNWASDAGKPQVFNVKYEYASQVQTSIFTNSVGFGIDGKQKLGTATKVTADIQGKCYVNYGTTKQVDTKSLFNANTGSGTKNNLDGKLLEDVKGVDPRTKQSNLVANFVRATAE